MMPQAPIQSEGNSPKEPPNGPMSKILLGEHGEKYISPSPSSYFGNGAPQCCAMKKEKERGSISHSVGGGGWRKKRDTKASIKEASWEKKEGTAE